MKHQSSAPTSSFWGEYQTIAAYSRRSTGSAEVVVCVIDSGIDYTHPDLQGNVWVNTGEIPNNGIDDDKNGYIDDYHGFNFLSNSGDPMDNNYHGTHLSGMVGALCNNNIGVCGVNQAVKVMGCKFLDGSGNGYTSDAVRSYLRLPWNAAWSGRQKHSIQQ